MRVLSTDPAPLASVRYLNAAPRGGRESRLLRVERAVVDVLPEGLDLLIATADLQGVVIDPFTRESVLLGAVVAEALEGLAADGVIAPLERAGVLLCGDLYTVPDVSKRGGFGDVRAVWQAFASRCRWVAGVAGNHDDVSGVRSTGNLHLLDMDVVEIDGLRIGGVGFISGNPEKRGRRSEQEQLERLDVTCVARPDVLLLHEGPRGGDAQPGNPVIGELLVGHPSPLVFCGHVRWESAVAEGPPQRANVCERVLVMTRGE